MTILDQAPSHRFTASTLTATMLVVLLLGVPWAEAQVDYGDAPDSYGTTVAASGPGHNIFGTFALGTLIDAEADGIPDWWAEGDDNDGTDDEDGVSFVGGTLLTACSTGNQLQVTVTQGPATSAYLDAWIDFDDSGTFDHPGEHLFGGTSTALAWGSNTLTYDVPCSTEPQFSGYARFRLSQAGGLLPNDTVAQAADGEVEDHLIELQAFDFGDAPDSYGTTLAANGPSHYRYGTFQLGTGWDADSDGQPGVGADGDDNDAEGDDDDGVTFVGGTTLVACSIGNQLAILVDQGGADLMMLDAWIDFDGSGTFEHPGEHLFGTSQTLVDGANILAYDVPCSASNQAVTYARFRLSQGGDLGPTDPLGPVDDGEVEDYAISIQARDFGDAPDSYGTLLASAGPSHGIFGTFSLGAAIDPENDGQPGWNADGDDTDGSDDEDGVTFVGGTLLTACSTGNQLQVSVTQGPATTALLDAWIDFDDSGTFDHPAEHLFGGTSAALAWGSNTLTYDVPCSAVTQFSSYARFRLSQAGSLQPNDTVAQAADGEVEDYLVEVQAFDLGDAPDSYGTTLALGGPAHERFGTFQLGAGWDADSDGQASAGADGDDSDAEGDDEDGVTFVGGTNLEACSTGNQLDVVVNHGGADAWLLDAWIDFDDSGTFDHPGEHLFGGTSQAMLDGINSLTYDVPCTAANQAVTYARFRLSQIGSLTPTDSAGPSATGEVEDYAISIQARDWGDAPDSYGTLAASAGPSHGILGTFRLGAAIDNESNGLPTWDASGDDSDGSDDEDGVTFVGGTTVVACSTGNQLQVSVNLGPVNMAFLDAWIDFDDSGTFDHPGEHLFGGTSSAVAGGSNTLTYDVPCSAVPQQSGYARFRLSQAGSLLPTDTVAQAADGEVEDYLIEVQAFDLGDAPDSYGTTLAAGGPAHERFSTFQLGAAWDAETDGQPGVGADGDDSDAEGDDEDGVTFVGGTLLEACATGNQLQVEVNGGGADFRRLDAWIDFDGSGTFEHPGEHLFDGVSQDLPVDGVNTLTYDVPCGVSQGVSYARFRLSQAGSLAPTDAAGPSADGEVEDYVVTFQAYDFGDAPDSYGTTLAAGGPGHGILDTFRLGAAIDSEADGQPTADATGDDSSGSDDEDGITFTGGSVLQACSIGNQLQVSVNQGSAATALLDGWIDFDGSGTFDHPAEHLFGGTSAALAWGTNTLTFDVPCSAVEQATSFARFRLSQAGGLAPTDAAGLAPDGEVEDQQVTIGQVFDFGDAPAGYPTLIADDGPRHLLGGGVYLGACIDGEADGQPSAAGDGDDTVVGSPVFGTCAGGDDEDGISVAGGVLLTGNTAQVEVTASAACTLSAWIDYNGDGDWDDPGEDLFDGVGQPLVAGVNTLSIPIPSAATAGFSYARFRATTDGAVAVTGQASDGEVEDLQVTLRVPNATIPTLGTYGALLLVLALMAVALYTLRRW